MTISTETSVTQNVRIPLHEIPLHEAGKTGTLLKASRTDGSAWTIWRSDVSGAHLPIRDTKALAELAAEMQECEDATQ